MNKEILTRYFAGKSSRWEKKQVQEYFQGEDMQVFDEYIKEQDQKSEELPVNESYKKKFYNTLIRRIDEKENAKPEKKSLPLYYYLKIAASILLICGVGGGLYIIKQRQEDTAKQPDYETIFNVTKSLQFTELTDGTKIWLNPGTKVSYDSKHYGDTSREINIAGEAYFDVAHNPKKPFRVHAGKIITTVTGTAFNIEAYQDEENVRVLLVRGRVQVSAGNLRHALSPGQMLEYKSRSNQTQISSVSISDKQTLFTSGKLVFENVPLRDVIKRLQAVFGLTLTPANNNLLKNKTVSGNYYRDNPEETLRRILFMHGLHLSKKGEKTYAIIN